MMSVSHFRTLKVQETSSTLLFCPRSPNSPTKVFAVSTSYDPESYFQTCFTSIGHLDFLVRPGIHQFEGRSAATPTAGGGDIWGSSNTTSEGGMA